jgi:hypothetical protein
MNESDDPKEPTEEVDHVRTKEPEAPFGSDEKNPSAVRDDTSEDKAEEALPGVGGFGDRDPATEMPRVPSAPATQDDSQPHDAAPKASGKERSPEK